MMYMSTGTYLSSDEKILILELLREKQLTQPFNENITKLIKHIENNDLCLRKKF